LDIFAANFYNSVETTDTDIIPLTIVNQKLLTEIVERGANNVCVVKYDTDDPNRSIIVEKE
jgi:hypothetical protein